MRSKLEVWLKCDIICIAWQYIVVILQDNDVSVNVIASLV